jgi:hypothetical protein
MLEAMPASIRSARAHFVHRADTSPHIPGILKNDYTRLFAFALLAAPERLPRWLARQAFPPIEVMALIYRSPVSPALYWRYASRLLRPIARIKHASEKAER